MNLDFKEKYVLENERVLLRPLELEDIELLVEYSINEPEIWRFNANGGNGKENLEKYISKAIKQRDNQQEYPFIVFDKKSKKYIGSTRFYDISNEFNRLEIGYTWYGKEFQGTGINKNCKYLLLEFAFEKLEMLRVGFRANSKNEKSINAMKSIGCTVEGLLRQFSRDAEGNIIDAIKLSILKHEWDKEVKINLKNKLFLKPKNQTEIQVVFAGTEIEASIVKMVLENEEIETYLKDEYIGTIFPSYATAGGFDAVKVCVSSADVEKALVIIEEYRRTKD